MSQKKVWLGRKKSSRKQTSVVINLCWENRLSITICIGRSSRLNEEFKVPKEEDSISWVEVKSETHWLIVEGCQDLRTLNVVSCATFVFTRDPRFDQLLCIVQAEGDRAWRHIPGAKVGGPQNDSSIWVTHLDHARRYHELNCHWASARVGQPIVIVGPVVWTLNCVTLEDVLVQITIVDVLPGLRSSINFVAADTDRFWPRQRCLAH